MTPVFVDTSFLLALVLTDDEHHDRAIAWQRATRGKLLTTEYVLIEVLDALAKPGLRGMALAIVASLESDPGIEVVGASTALMRRGVEFYRVHADKEWGVTDCISFVAMRDAGLQDALTSDHHFEQSGFRALLRMPPP
jgi:uncharacterized protein